MGAGKVSAFSSPFTLTVVRLGYRITQVMVNALRISIFVPVVCLFVLVCAPYAWGETEDLMPPVMPGDTSEPPDVLKSPFYPCSGCHATMKVNYTKRVPSAHPDKELKGHGEPIRWCLDCHNAEDRDFLRLIGGEKVPFEKSYILCGQCHGPVYRDWQYGAHGKRTGYWNGEKTFMICTKCHNPHHPRFPRITPEPAPTPPEETLR